MNWFQLLAYARPVLRALGRRSGAVLKPPQDRDSQERALEVQPGQRNAAPNRTRFATELALLLMRGRRQSVRATRLPANVHAQLDELREDGILEFDHDVYPGQARSCSTAATS